MKRWIFLFPFLGALSWAAQAEASCGAAICPLNTHHSLAAGRLHLQLSHEYINQNQINISSKKSFVGALPNAHDEIKTINQRILLQLQYGITNRFSLKTELPFIQREHSHWEDTTMESFDFEGIGDLMTVGEYTILFSNWEYAPRLTLLAESSSPPEKRTRPMRMANKPKSPFNPALAPGME